MRFVSHFGMLAGLQLVLLRTETMIKVSVIWHVNELGKVEISLIILKVVELPAFQSVH